MANISEVMQKDFLELDASTKITEAIGKLSKKMKDMQSFSIKDSSQLTGEF